MAHRGSPSAQSMLQIARRGPRFETRCIAHTAAMPARADVVLLAVVAVEHASHEMRCHK